MPKSPVITELCRFFNDRPVEVGGFTFWARHVVPHAGQAQTREGWTLALEFAEACEAGSSYWLGDLIEYLDTREDWREQRTQLRSLTKLARHTLENLATVSRKVKGRARELAPTISHASRVTSLEPPVQEVLLQQARDDDWTVPRLTKAVKQHKSGVVLEGQAETMHTVDVTIRLSVEAVTPYAAEQAAWALLKNAVKGCPHAHVISAHAQPHVGTRRKKKAA